MVTTNHCKNGGYKDVGGDADGDGGDDAADDSGGDDDPRYDRSRLLVVMELMEGGELFDRIKKSKYFSEAEAVKYTLQVCLETFF